MIIRITLAIFPGEEESRGGSRVVQKSIKLVVTMALCGSACSQSTHPLDQLFSGESDKIFNLSHDIKITIDGGAHSLQPFTDPTLEVNAITTLFTQLVRHKLSDWYQVKTSIVFDDLRNDNGERTPGICHYKEQRIHINHTMWEGYSSTQRTILVLHELGHCELNRRHTEKRILIEGGVDAPESLMNRGTVRDFAAFRANPQFYLRELVQGLVKEKPQDAVLVGKPRAMLP